MCGFCRSCIKVHYFFTHQNVLLSLWPVSPMLSTFCSIVVFVIYIYLYIYKRYNILSFKQQKFALLHSHLCATIF